MPYFHTVSFHGTARWMFSIIVFGMGSRPFVSVRLEPVVQGQIICVPGVIESLRFTSPALAIFVILSSSCLSSSLSLSLSLSL